MKLCSNPDELFTKSLFLLVSYQKSVMVFGLVSQLPVKHNTFQLSEVQWMVLPLLVPYTAVLLQYCSHPPPPRPPEGLHLHCCLQTQQPVHSPEVLLFLAPPCGCPPELFLLPSEFLFLSSCLLVVCFHSWTLKLLLFSLIFTLFPWRCLCSLDVCMKPDKLLVCLFRLCQVWIWFHSLLDHNSLI